MEKNILLVLALCLAFNGCAPAETSTANQTENKATAGAKAETGENAVMADRSENAAQTESTKTENAESQTGQPRTVREFFDLLPPKYFTLEGCQPEKDRNCKRARGGIRQNFSRNRRREKRLLEIGLRRSAKLSDDGAL